MKTSSQYRKYLAASRLIPAKIQARSRTPVLRLSITSHPVPR